jgi:hypothetical protein
MCTECAPNVRDFQVNLGLRNKVNMTSELVRRINDALKANNVEATNLGGAKRQMLKIRDEIATPLQISNKRLDMQHSRPQREMVEDNLHMVRPKAK